MKNVTYLGMCFALTFGLVAVALGQQQSGGQSALQPPQQGLNGIGNAPQAGAADWQQSGINQKGGLDQQRAVPAPSGPEDRSMLKAANTWQPGQPATINVQPRGELGVWLMETNGPGVQIKRVTPDSAAQKAGLHEGDVILQVNGRGFTSPQAASQMIRQIPIGQAGMLTIWRDGNQQQLQVTLQAAREMNGEMSREINVETSHQVGFGGVDAAVSGDLAARTMKLEQQISSLTQELQQLRQELAQLRSAGSPQPNALNTETPHFIPPSATTEQPETKSGASTLAPPPATPAPPTPPPAFGKADEKVAAPPAEPFKPATPPTPPAAEKPAASDPFGAAPAPAPPKAEEKPKTDEKKAGSDKGNADDLFK